MTVGPEQGAEHFLGVIRTAVVVEASSSFRVPSGTGASRWVAATRAPSGRGLWEVRKGRRQRGYYKVSSSFPRRADEECWGSPAPGYRAYGSGVLWVVGGDGYSWSSTIRNSNIYFLHFGYNGVNPQSNNYRAYGLQLRCLQE